MEHLIKLINDKCINAKPLLLVIRGSHAYGTNIETSDIDYAGIFIQDINDILGNGYVEQINDDKNDTVIYEIKRFLQLIKSNNPTCLELLYTPEDCVLYKDPILDELFKNRDKFITKKCGDSFGGYSVAQIKKAKGQNKKQNWDRDKVTRKTPLDFCKIILKSKSKPLLDYLNENNLYQELCGLTNVSNARDLYALYYDYYSHNKYKVTSKFKKFYLNLPIISYVYNYNKPLHFKGIIIEDSNDIRQSNIPMETPNTSFIGHISYNKDGYMEHCKDYRSYIEWVTNRNETRWSESIEHGQKVDGKNLMHSFRLTQMGLEIAQGKGVIVRRDNKDELIKIRKGEVILNDLINDVEEMLFKMDENIKISNLPDEVDNDLVNDLLLNIRRKTYKLD